MSKWNRALCAVSCLLFLAVGTAHADRRASLSGNLLIDDQDDVFLFPNEIVRYRNLISLDYGLDSQTGNALFTLGNDRAGYGFALHHGDALRPLGTNLNGPSQLGMRLDLPSLFSTADFVAGIDQAPATMLDFIYGRNAGSFDWGLRASLGRGAFVTTDAMGNETGAEQLYFMGEFGYGSGVRGQETRTDLSVSAMIDLGKEVAGGVDQSSAFAAGLNGLMRMYIPMQTDVDLGVLANLGVGSTSVSDDSMDPSNTHSRFNLGLGGGVGAALKFGRANVAAYALMRFDLRNEDANSETDNDAAESSTVGVVVPGLLASVEVPVTDWFYVRSGAQYDFDLSFVSRGDDSGQAVVDGAFGWNAGLGVLVDDFRFDGTLTQGFVTNGPNFIGGGNGFLAMASLTYVFDKDRDGANHPINGAQTVAEEPAPEEAPDEVAAPPMLTPPPAAAEPPPPGPAVAPAPEATTDGAAGGQVQTNAQTAPTGAAASGAASGSIGGTLSTP